MSLYTHFKAQVYSIYLHGPFGYVSNRDTGFLRARYMVKLIKNSDALGQPVALVAYLPCVSGLDVTFPFRI